MRKWLLLSSLCLITSLTAAEHRTIFLIGDSTVRNGRGDGAGGLWGWGDFLADHFDTNLVRVVNLALGGRSSRTFLTEGHWDKVKKQLHPGNFVLMQFGHNDGGEIAKGDRPRASLKGDGEESKKVTVEKTGASEIVHTYGWYLRRYVADTKAAGATAIVLSPIPRNIWKEGKITRASSGYGKWAAEAAKDSGALFVDLNELIARRYEEMGQPRVASELFTAKDHTHTTRTGAQLNADCVAVGLRDLTNSPFKPLLRSQ